MHIGTFTVYLIIASFLFAFSAIHAAGQGESGEANPVVVMETTLGTIKIELWRSEAPVTVKNFLRYVDEKFYDGTLFHRIIRESLIQGGGLTMDMKPKKNHEPIVNEASAGLKNDAGTIVMARTREIHSATSQFFINMRDNYYLDHRDDTIQGYGYVAFGRVIEGMDIVKQIGSVKTDARDMPVIPVVIKRVRRAGEGTSVNK